MRTSLTLSCWLVFLSSALAQPSFGGVWDTSYGRMTLTQNGDKISGFYEYESGRSTLEGKLNGKRFEFTYKEPDAHGEGWFELGKDGQSFEGKWRQAGAKEWEAWHGRRAQEASVAGSFDGVWTTSFGRMRLVQTGDDVEGSYDLEGGSTIKGTVSKGKLTFRYKEPKAEGEAWFQLSADGKSFTGKWRQQGSSAWSDWTGSRVVPVVGRVWLVVVEANWESNLAQQEYTFGGMLRSFFARSSDIQVRHRFFTDEESLKRWCGEVAYLAEPAVLVLATHGSAKGIPVRGREVGAKTLAQSLRFARNLKLLHFSACELMKGSVATEMHASLAKGVTPAISGYKTSVDWAASAVIEFLYLDMVLIRKMTPEAAGEQIVKLMPFAGDSRTPGTILPAAGFRLVKP